MSDKIDVVELACEIARFAGTTNDPQTERLLLVLIEQLLRVVGLSPGNDQISG